MKKYVGSLVLIAGLFGFTTQANAEAVMARIVVDGMSKLSSLDIKGTLVDANGNEIVKTLTGVKSPRSEMAFRGLDPRQVVSLTIHVVDTTTSAEDIETIETMVEGNELTDARFTMELQ